MDDDLIAQFTSITSAAPERAQQYLTISDGNLEQAVQLYFESGGIDMGGAFGAEPPSAPSATPSHPAGTVHDAIRVDSDDESEGGIALGSQQRPTTEDEALARKLQEDDEAMARRLQEEAYGAGGAGSMGPGAAGIDIDPDTGVRRPMQRTQETLAGPLASLGYDDEEELQHAVREQLRARQGSEWGLA